MSTIHELYLQEIIAIIGGTPCLAAEVEGADVTLMHVCTTVELCPVGCDGGHPVIPCDEARDDVDLAICKLDWQCIMILVNALLKVVFCVVNLKVVGT